MASRKVKESLRANSKAPKRKAVAWPTDGRSGKRKAGRTRKIQMHVTGLNAAVEAVSVAATKAVQKAIDGALVNGEQQAPTAADLIAQLRPHIRGIDAVISGCVVAGVDPYLVVKFQTDSTSLFENMLLALARAP